MGGADVSATQRSVDATEFETAFPTTDLAMVLEHAPDAYERLRDAYEEAFRAADPQLLELARVRIRSMVNPAASKWTDGEEYNPAQRACLAFAEQFAFYVADIGQAQIDGLLAELPADQVYGLINGIYVIDAVERLTAVLSKVYDEGGRR
jgi:hypothetical protein